MSQEFQIKRGDTLPVLSATMRVRNSLTGVVSAVDLTTATGIEFYFKSGTTVLTRTGTPTTTPEDGIATYAFVAADWDALTDIFAVGNYSFEVQVTFPTGVLSVPTKGYGSVVVYSDLED